MACLCLIVPHLDSMISDTSNIALNSYYLCNLKEKSLSIGNPIEGGNFVAFLIGITLYSSMKLGMIYLALLCMNLFYRLWRPLQKLGIKKRNIHLFTFITVILLDCIVIGLNGIDVNPSNGIAYISPNKNLYLFIFCEILPNVIYIIVSVPCIMFAIESLRRELNLIRNAEMVFSDLVNLINRLTWFLMLSTVSFSYVVLVEIYWLIMSQTFRQSTKKWLQCVEDGMMKDGLLTYSYKIGDTCHQELRDDHYIFPGIWLFLSLPILAFGMNLSTILMTCHRRQSERWFEGM